MPTTAIACAWRWPCDDEPYEVTARTVRDAQAVEALLRPLAHLCIDPPQEGRNCLSPKAHPALWSDAG